MQASVVCKGTTDRSRKGKLLHKRIVEAHGVKQLLEMRLSQSHSTQSGSSESESATAIPDVKRRPSSRELELMQNSIGGFGCLGTACPIGDVSCTVAPAQSMSGVFRRRSWSFRRADPAKETMMQP